MNKRINFDYLNLWKELPLFYLLTFTLRRRKTGVSNGRILIVNPCLMGEFAASIPAIADCIQRNKDKKIDLMVSPPLKILAEKIAGVNNVYPVRSVYKRPTEHHAHDNNLPSEYEEIILLRVSSVTYKFLLNVSAGKVRSGAAAITGYALHLFLNLILRQTPKQWGDFNFRLLGGRPRHISFDEIFNLRSSDYERVKTLLAVISANKKIIIHTGSSWRMMHWENDRWVELLEKINKLGSFEFIFIGAKKDISDYEYISSRLKFKTYSIIDQINVLELLLLMRLADYFIGVDSGPSNLAHIADLRSLVIYGPGPHLYWPSNHRDIVLDKSNGRGFYQRFFYKKNGFIQRISVEEVYSAFIKLFEKQYTGGI